jgi:tRNA pseudouridine38-40 synthase
MDCRFVSESFHARFSAKRKIYRYRVWNGEVLPPLENGRAWHVRDPIDREVVARAAKLFIGEHEFASFAANRGVRVADTVREIYAVRVRKSGPLLTFDFEGNGFLYKMVRMMMGALIQIGVRKASVDEVQSRLLRPRRATTAERNVAPASGLFLLRVRY